MIDHYADWIAATGLRVIGVDPEASAIPDEVLGDPGLSLIAKGLYALVLSYQGQPVDPYEDAFEDASEIEAAIRELIGAGLIIRVARPS